MKSYSIKDIAQYLPGDAQIVGRTTATFSNVRPIHEADSDSLVWINPKREDKKKLADATKAEIIVCDSSINHEASDRRCYIIVSDPKLIFLRIVEALFKPAVQPGIHPTAFIHPEAEVHPDAYIGPFTYVGISKIGSGTIIYGHCHIYDNVVIGSQVIIHAGVIIGSDGFGFARNEAGEMEKFPHVGNVIIEDRVEIGANCCIDRGTLGTTLLKKGAKLDNFVHIAHNVVVGQDAALTAHAMVAGSTVIGDQAWISPCSALRDGIRIGDKSFVGIGAVVTKSVPDKETWTGNPARPLKEFAEMLAKIKRL
jgi:UDP-3-O-[3-hydroxymyristoyl] glucosamine N-acyltransferase